MLLDKDTYGLVVVGRKRASIGYIKGTRIHIMKDFSSGIPSKQSAGGQSQSRFDRLLQEREIRFYRRLIKHVNQKFLRLKNLRAIFVGGAGNSKKKFVKDKNIDYRLKPIIKDTIDLPYDGGYEGIRALVNQLSDQLIDLQYIREQQIGQKFLKELSVDSGLAIYGYEEIKKALIANTVSKLIISEGFKNINDFLSITHKNGVQVEIISKETEEGEMIYKSFGGIVAFARYSR
jgi:peptide chain release factor subunit 1